jgi:4-amino-4-deoxy-L-arabinose transferase-like glycosyltransferase
MQASDGFSVICGIVIGAILLDVLLIWTWRYIQNAVRARSPTTAASELYVPRGFASVARPVRNWLSTAYESVQDTVQEISGQIRGNGRAQLRMFVVLACLFTTISLGYVYADHSMVRGWQLWTFLLCVLVAVVAMLPGNGSIPGDRFPFRPRRHHLWIVGLLLAAALLRVLFLEQFPPGLHVDEFGTADFTLRHVFPPQNLTLSPFRTGQSSQPSLYNYLVRLSLAVVGESITGLRITSALAGSTAVVATYALVSVLQSRRTALFAAILVTVSHFHIHWSRIGLNNIWDTVWVPLILAAYAWGWRKNWSSGAVLAGLALGLSQYFYAGSRIVLFLLPFLMYSLWRKERDNPRLVEFAVKTYGMAAVVAAPLAIFGIQFPEEFGRRLITGLIWGSDLPPQEIPSVGERLIDTLISFTALPENTGFYRPGVPLVFGLAVPLFIAGILWAIRERQFMPVLWIGLTMFFGGFLLQALPSSNHYLVAVPAIGWLVAMPMEALFGFGRLRIAVVMLLLVVVSELGFYYGIYARAPSPDLVLAFPENPWK